MIPVIDLAAGGDGSSELQDQIATAYRDVGFAYIVGHEVPKDVIDGVFDASRRFHGLPLEAKMAVELDERHRGYIAIDTSTDRASTLAAVTRPNQSASFMAMREAGPDDPDVVAGQYLAGPNQWPDLPGFREAVEAFGGALTALSRRLMKIFARILGDTTGVLEHAFEVPTTWLRLLHYPPRASGAPRDLYGSAPHIDFGALTLLAQDDVGGLQVRTPAGEWIDVPPRPNAFVLNTGDMLHRWSNGRLLATAHRVINTSAIDRYSCAFFFDPHMATVVEPLPGSLRSGEPARFDPVEFGARVRAELSVGYDRHAQG